MTTLQFLLINIGAFVTAAGGIFLKRLSDQLDHSSNLSALVLFVFKSPYLWMGGFCYVFPVLLWTYLLKYMDLTKLQPLLAIVYIYTILLSVLLLGESPSAFRLLGIALIIAGVIVVGRS